MAAALLMGGVVGVILGYLAMLPLFLGLFFFLLLGLIPGAVLFRFADPIRPIPIPSLVGGGVLLLAFIGSVSGYVEYRSLPGHVTVKVIKTIIGGFPEGYEREALAVQVTEKLRAYLRERYGSGGMVGYVRWAAANGRIEIPAGTIRLPGPGGNVDKNAVTLELGSPAVHRLHQPGMLWCIRVGVSMCLLTLAIALQIVPLHRPPRTDADEADEPDEHSDTSPGS